MELGGEISFSCIPTTSINSVQWYINNSQFSANRSDVDKIFISAGDGYGLLHFREVLLSDNLTRVHCEVVFAFDSSSAISAEASLVVAGLYVVMTTKFRLSSPINFLKIMFNLMLIKKLWALLLC